MGCNEVLGRTVSFGSNHWIFPYTLFSQGFAFELSCYIPPLRNVYWDNYHYGFLAQPCHRLSYIFFVKYCMQVSRPVVVVCVFTTNNKLSEWVTTSSYLKLCQNNELHLDIDIVNLLQVFYVIFNVWSMKQGWVMLAFSSLKTTTSHSPVFILLYMVYTTHPIGPIIHNQDSVMIYYHSYLSIRHYRSHGIELNHLNWLIYWTLKTTFDTMTHYLHLQSLKVPLKCHTKMELAVDYVTNLLKYATQSAVSTSLDWIWTTGPPITFAVHWKRRPNPRVICSELKTVSCKSFSKLFSAWCNTQNNYLYTRLDLYGVLRKWLNMSVTWPCAPSAFDVLPRYLHSFKWADWNTFLSV